MEHLRHTAVWFPSRVKIAGRAVGVPTLGHWRLLECIGSPMLDDGAEVSPGEAALALAVLSRPWRDARRMLRSPWLRAFACIRLPTVGESAALMAWLRETWWSPARFVREGARKDGLPPCVPLSVRIAAEAVAGRWCELPPFPRGTVWDLTIPEALLARVAFGEIDGNRYEAPGEAEAVAAALARLDQQPWKGQSQGCVPSPVGSPRPLRNECAAQSTENRSARPITAPPTTSGGIVLNK